MTGGWTDEEDQNFEINGIVCMFYARLRADSVQRCV